MDNNSKLALFKEFVKNNSFLISYVKKGEKSWQDMYEIYDLYGEDEKAWEKFLLESNKDNKKNTNRYSGYFDDLVNMAKKIDVNKVQEGITSLQKTLGLFGEMFVGKKDNNTREYNPRPLYRRFED